MRGQRREHGDQIGILRWWRQRSCRSWSERGQKRSHRIKSQMGIDSLSGGLVSAQGDLVAVAGWSLWVLDLLGGQYNTSLLTG